MAQRSNPPLYLAHSPLAYFIAQVRFAEILSLDRHIPAIHDQLRRVDLPIFKHSVIQALRVDAGGPPVLDSRDVWYFESLDASTGIVATRDSVALHTTQYETFERTTPRFFDGLARINDVVGIDVLQRCGLRYVDLVYPRNDDTLATYLKPEILGLSGAEFGVTPKAQSAMFSGASESGTLVVKFATETFPAVMPPDLMPVSLKLDLTIEAGAKVGVLDFDHYSEHQERFTVERAAAVLDGLHDAIDRAFRSCVSETALSRWGKRDA